MKKISMLTLSFLLTIVLLAACGDKDNASENSDNNGNQDTNAKAELPEPDLEGIPDVVAEVNGEEVTKEDFEGIYQQQFQQQAMQAQMSGEEIDQDKLKKQTAEGLIGQELLTQEANDRVSDVSEEEIDKTIDELVKQNGMESKDDLLAALEEQGVDEKEFMSQVETQVKVDKVIEEESGDTGDMEPTDDEIKEAYETMKSQSEQADSDEEVPAFDEVKSEIKDQLQQQNKQAAEAKATQKFVDKLRKDADVTVHI